ncbi:DUF4429 domain-containing protein [Streptomyces sp. NPDC058391]|uniref:DUF4429 domain-containing protein n=1 Tax=unclassified Streptomyces TaxID=2593676 RepID=UPI00364DBF30
MSEALGVGGHVAFDGQYVTITRKGFLARATVGKGEKRLHVSQIGAIQWKPAGPIMNGFIQFTLPGGNERLSHFGSQTSSAGKDENSVVFDKKRQPEFEALRSDVEAAIVQHHAPKPSGAPAAESLADELTKLAALRDRGVLSPQEFEQQKARLLG